MATSGIFDHITINNPKAIEDYGKAMEEAANKPGLQEEADIKFTKTQTAITYFIFDNDDGRRYLQYMYLL